MAAQDEALSRLRRPLWGVPYDPDAKNQLTQFRTVESAGAYRCDAIHSIEFPAQRSAITLRRVTVPYAILKPYAHIVNYSCGG